MNSSPPPRSPWRPGSLRAYLCCGWDPSRPRLGPQLLHFPRVSMQEGKGQEPSPLSSLLTATAGVEQTHVHPRLEWT